MAEAAWLEVSLVVNGELAEAVAEVIARFAPNGVVIESTAIKDEINGPGSPTGPLRVCGYLVADARLEETRQRLEESLWYLGRIQALPTPEFKVIQEINWMEAWKEHYHPVLIGKKIVILPLWYQNPAPERTSIKIDPGMAFGTGTHPTTQLSLELLEDYLRPGKPLLDVGCGSGILTIAALKLGASQAFGVDVDQKSIDAAYQNATHNQVEAEDIFALGSVENIQAGVFPIRQAPVVIANILAPILIRLLDSGMADLIAEGGLILLSGILDEKEPDMLAALEKHGLEVIERRQMTDWVALVATR